ncbi:SIMPL domain-containing protein [Hyphobacterium sp. HN65]|uniref:SIMPL domain-containing protein n=1 Tax=Hyphobacterium lacteum TaxID=3116575 RepID=A0ABU7LS10_9PROT|nr:SIMPL domain-containing protein [Hyphobacterium sp. HN65]MEE2526374.1 SIMPL domain-containing protein [Hyphobacterium sp. HN65]
MIRALLLATALTFPAATAMAQDDEPGRLSLSATGEVQAVPDMATVRSGVVTEARTASEALNANSRRMNGVFAALARAGIAREDIQTSNLQINPVWSNYSAGEERRITGYRATNTVTARVDELDELGQTIDALVSSGANNIEGVTFGLEDDAAARREARLRAVAELRETAELYAGALNVELGRLLEFSESGGYSPQPTAMFARAESFDAATPVAAGQLTISVTITGVYAIED